MTGRETPGAILAPRPRTMAQVVYEFHAALDNGGIEPPYIVVGHSSGALLARLFAEDFAGDVAGVVLVDGTHEDIRLSIAGKLLRVRETGEGRSIPDVQTTLPEDQRTLSGDELQTAVMMREFAGAPAIAPPYDRLPAEAQCWRSWALARSERFIADDDPFGRKNCRRCTRRGATIPPLLAPNRSLSFRGIWSAGRSRTMMRSCARSAARGKRIWRACPPMRVSSSPKEADTMCRLKGRMW